MPKRVWPKGKGTSVGLARGRQGGQSVVELALTFPILLLFFVGLIEVGLILHSYMVLVNANREAARYAGRAQEFESEEGEDITNEVIAYRAIRSASSLDLNMARDGGNFSVFIHRFQIDTGQAGDDSDNDIRINGVPSQIDCPAPCIHTCAEWFDNYVYTSTVWYTGTETTALGETRFSAVDPLGKCRQLYDDNEVFNEDMATYEAAIERQTPPIGEDDGIYETSVLEVVIIELFYDHPQVLKLPFFTVLIPDPIALHCDTQMRLTGVGRQKGVTE